MRNAIGLVICCLLFAACNFGPSQAAVDLRVSVERALSPGAPPEQIQAFLTAHTDHYGFLPEIGQYTGYIDITSKWSSVVIVVYVDKEGRYLRSDVRDVTIAP
jgi:hypothetical protein